MEISWNFCYVFSCDLNQFPSKAYLFSNFRYEDASHSFKTAALLHENVAGGNSIWLHWADFLEGRLDAEKYVIFNSLLFLLQKTFQIEAHKNDF